MLVRDIGYYYSGESDEKWKMKQEVYEYPKAQNIPKAFYSIVSGLKSSKYGSFEP